MKTQLTIQEKLKDLRVSEKKKKLKEVAEETGISLSSLSNYESNEFKDISPFALVTLAKYYGVSTDYLLGLTEARNHPDVKVAELHLSDDMLELLRSDKINHRLLNEFATHERFKMLMYDMEIFVDRIADMRIQNMNSVMEATRQQIIQKYHPEMEDVYTRTLDVVQIGELDFFRGSCMTILTRSCGIFGKRIARTQQPQMTARFRRETMSRICSLKR